jgi:phosphoribosylformimino-5-aminoimidazole carboxamide ribotide isomerase
MTSPVIPSIDIEGGRAVKRVRGRRGEYVFVGNPLELARRFRRAGLVHVVDLDGAEAGRPVNVAVVEAISRALERRCQLGGGLRSEESIQWALANCNVAVLGSLPFREPRLFAEAAGRYRDSLAVSLDVRRDVVMVDGWKRAALPLSEALARLSGHGVFAALIVTSIDVEGTGAGFRAPAVSVNRMRELARRLYYAGGVRTCRDVEEALRAGFDGVIVGYSLYRGDLSECASF